MRPVPIPSDEAERLRRLRADGLLNAAPEAEFDRLAALGASLFSAPICLISFIGADDQWLKARAGTDVEQTPRSVSFCTHAIMNETPLVVFDATRDDRFRENPLVAGDAGFRFYAGAPIIDNNGTKLGAFCVIDRQPRKQFTANEAQLLSRLAATVSALVEARSAQRSARAVDSFANATGLAIMTADADGTVTSWNSAAERLFGHAANIAVGSSIDIIIPERFRAAHEEGLKRVRMKGETRLVGRSVEVMALRADGSEFPAELFLSAWETDAGPALGAHVQDISARRAREAELQHRASHDELTGLINLNGFRDRVQKQIETSGSVAVLGFDLDGFKRANDTLGHATGDALLQAVAIRLLSCSDPNWVVGRLGGDEFAIMLPARADLFTARNAAKTLLSVFSEPFDISGHRVLLSASIGAAFAPQHATDAEELLARADLAMFRAKRSGGRCFRLFDATMRGELEARRVFEDELLTAHAERQWELHYQPQVYLPDGLLTGVEALLRWRHPRCGLLMPGAFMPVLETHFVSYEVGGWVLDEACRQLAEWRSRGVDVPRVSVNLFSSQLHDGHIARDTREALIRHGLRPGDLELEITESIALRYDKESLAPLLELVDHGVGIALDDFGTGFASLATLKRFPLTRLKVDRSFVSDICQDSHSAAVVKSLVTLGDALGIDVVAEGIETPEQCHRLVELGCLHGQGHLFAAAEAGAASPAANLERPRRRAKA